jgi:hypothetical protein
VDIRHGDMAEKQLDPLIECRARKGEVDTDEREEELEAERENLNHPQAGGDEGSVGLLP